MPHDHVALVQLMAWCRTGDKLLPEPVMANQPMNISIHGFSVLTYPSLEQFIMQFILL